MIELGTGKREKIIPICRGSNDVSVSSAAEGRMGRVWTEDMDSPSFCLVKNGPFAFLLGIPPKGENALSLYRTLRIECPGSFIVPENEGWSGWIEENVPCRQRMLSRYEMGPGRNGFDPEKLNFFMQQVPDGFILKKIDRYVFRHMPDEDWCRYFVSNFENETQFFRHGTGYVITKNSRPVSGCSAFSFSEGKVEAEAGTKEEFRRMGLALSSSSAFVTACLLKNLEPVWDAANIKSVALAEKLGFETKREYTVIQIQEEDFDRSY